MFKRSLIFIVLMFFLVAPAPAQAAELHMYCGAGLRIPADKVVKKFEAQTGHKVTVEFGGMGQLLTRFNASKAGDVFLSGSEDYIAEIARNKEVLTQHRIVFHTAVMAVQKSRADGIKTFADLAKSNLRLGMGDPQAIALGRAGEIMLDSSGYGKELRAKVIVRGTTIKQVLMYLENNEVDAAVIGHSDAVKNEKLVILPTPAGTPQEVIAIAALTTSKNHKAAVQLADFFSLTENINIFVDAGFLPLGR